MARSAVLHSGKPSNGAKPDARRGSISGAQPQDLEDHQQDTHAGMSQPGPGVQFRGAGSGLQGFGIATCCHHRCSWEHYVGRDLFQKHGMSEQDFQLLTWMTGMAHLVPVSCL